MTNSPKHLTIERYLEDTITEYLKDQNAAAEYPYNFDAINELELQNARERDKTYHIVEEVLNDILEDVERTTLFQAKYKEAYKGHHQYPLFDPDDILPGFILDDALIHQLCFREALIISNIDEPAASGDGKTMKPKPVGGLCLKIEIAKGFPPSQQKSATESNKNLLERIKKIKQECLQQSMLSPSEREKGETEEEKLKNYEMYLMEQSKLLPKKFVVHLASEFNVEGKNAGSRIVSWVDTYLHTLEERRTEHILQDEKTFDEQILYYALQDNKYFVKHRESFEVTRENRKYYPLIKANNLIGEGANFILMRYLAIKKYKGTFELSTMYINGDLCRNIYECRGPKPGWINGIPVEVCKIYRTIIEQCGIVHQSVTVLTVYGLIISQEWEGCPYIIHINPLQITQGRPVPYDYLALKKMWESNMELLSKFMDCKSEAEKKMKTYLKDHEEIKDMLADFLQSVLLLKPDNIIPFTIDYFSNFETLNLPKMPYFNEMDDSRDNEDIEILW
ncbi:ciliogenesis-associated TTC17-interacting protein-like [Anthonomus grandis grandis]|uniref:ciliogenesis-associated TTC17-interacting protein-like n=1 Tax=Anthonomus grandis grandis TaxID=2921223 RepID=UPI002165085A|nr:ciliogenesis-associated TTC17-interacting protein-like [Anthonomus grandis grandis]